MTTNSLVWGRRGRDRMVAGCITIYVPGWKRRYFSGTHSSANIFRIGMSSLTVHVGANVDLQDLLYVLCGE
jgi:hypothetical protein